MTNQEALDIFVSCATLDCEHCNMSFRGCEDKPRFNEMRDMVISALEKQIPKKPVKRTINNPVKIGNVTFSKGTSVYKCPNCGGLITYYKYCCSCGQAIDWRNNDE